LKPRIDTDGGTTILDNESHPVLNINLSSLKQATREDVARAEAIAAAVLE